MRKILVVLIGVMLMASIVGCSTVHREVLQGNAHEIGVWELQAYDVHGNPIWKEEAPNGLADEGEKYFLDCFLRATNCPTTCHLRLFNDTPGETDTIADLTGEPSTYGYVAEELTRDATGWPTLALDSGDYMATAKSVTFVATGGSWGPVTYAVFACTISASEKLISYAVLSAPRTLASGESLQAVYKLKLQ